jgi:hypothetical protein|uniref:Uncharacterized protein n=1 Tax=Myoviridae sp. ctIty1 TaxID=2827673 RepID=A0A8S5THI3_9CAUD|nr:MAG TPA: hypothetical protein [Myoviridae sp. ctIty1]
MTTYAEIFKDLIVELEDGTKMLNLCPHPTVYEAKDQSFSITFPTVGKEAALRLPVKSSEEEKGGITFGKTETLPIELPKQVEGLLYIVPTLIRTTYSDRKDFVSPTTDPKMIIKDENGFTKAVQKFDVNW